MDIGNSFVHCSLPSNCGGWAWGFIQFLNWSQLLGPGMIWKERPRGGWKFENGFWNWWGQGGFRKKQTLAFLLLFFYLSSPSIPFSFLSPLPSFILSDSPHLAERRRYFLNLCQWQKGCSLFLLYLVHLYPPIAASFFPVSILLILTPQIPQLVLIQRVRLDRFLGEEWNGEKLKPPYSL